MYCWKTTVNPSEKEWEQLGAADLTERCALGGIGPILAAQSGPFSAIRRQVTAVLAVWRKFQGGHEYETHSDGNIRRDRRERRPRGGAGVDTDADLEYEQQHQQQRGSEVREDGDLHGLSRGWYVAGDLR